MDKKNEDAATAKEKKVKTNKEYINNTLTMDEYNKLTKNILYNIIWHIQRKY